MCVCVVVLLQEDVEHDEHCSVCKEEGELQPCHNCTRAYHPDCLQPPLKTPPRAAWYCPKCQKKVRPDRILIATPQILIYLFYLFILLICFRGRVLRYTGNTLFR